MAMAPTRRRLLTERREDLVSERTRALNRLHVLLRDLLSDTVRKQLSTDAASKLLRRARPKHPAGRICRRLASEVVRDVRTLDRRIAEAALVTFSTSWRLIHRLVLSWRLTKRLGHRSRRKGNTLGWVVWALMSVMLVCLVLWAATGAVWLLFGAVVAALGVLCVVLLTNL